MMGFLVWTIGAGDGSELAPQLRRLTVVGAGGKHQKDGAKMVAVCVDKKPDEVIFDDRLAR